MCVCVCERVPPDQCIWYFDSLLSRRDKNTIRTPGRQLLQFPVERPKQMPQKCHRRDEPHGLDEETNTDAYDARSLWEGKQVEDRVDRAINILSDFFLSPGSPLVSL